MSARPLVETYTDDMLQRHVNVASKDRSGNPFDCIWCVEAARRGIVARTETSRG